MLDASVNTLVLVERTPDHPLKNEIYFELQSIKSKEVFVQKLRSFLDQIDHYRFLEHISMRTDALLTSERKAFHESLISCVKSVLTEIRMSLGGREDSLLGISNVLGNLKTMCMRPDLKDLQVKGNFSAIVVSAGPSLDLEMERLHAVQHEFLIIAVDAVYKKLISAGVVPTIVVSTERVMTGKKFFESSTDKGSLLIGQATIPPVFFELFQGYVATCSKYLGIFYWLPLNKKMFWAGSSVAHLAYRVADFLGAESIALVGQDLAYHPETFQSHAELPMFPDWSTQKKAEELIESKSAFWVKGVTHQKVLTTPIWQRFFNEFEFMKSFVSTPTLNTSVLGREMPAFEFMPFEEWTKGRASKGFEFCFPKSNPQEKTLLADCLKKIDDGVGLLLRSKEEILSAMQQSDMNRLKYLYAQVKENKDLLGLCMEPAITDFVKCENKIYFPEVDQKKVLIDFFSQYLQIIEKLIPMLQDSRHSLDASV